MKSAPIFLVSSKLGAVAGAGAAVGRSEVVEEEARVKLLVKAALRRALALVAALLGLLAVIKAGDETRIGRILHRVEIALVEEQLLLTRAGIDEIGVDDIVAVAHHQTTREGVVLDGTLTLVRTVGQMERLALSAAADDEILRQRAVVKRSLAADIEKKDYDRRWAAYQSLISVIAQSGYKPSDQELADTGMSRELADALLKEFQRTRSSGGGGGVFRTGTGGYSGKSTASAASSGSKEAVKLSERSNSEKTRRR